MPRILPTEEQLRTWYLEQDWTVNAISKHTGYPFYKIKEWLLSYGMWDQERADRNKAKLTTKTPGVYEHVNFEPMDADEAATEGQPEQSEGEQLPAVDTRTQVAPADDDTAWTRLNARQRTTAMTYAECMCQPVKLTNEEIAGECGIAVSTLREDMRNVDFQEVCTELINRNARFIINSGMHQDLIKLLETGRIGARDRETYLKFLQLLGPDTMIQIANVLPHRSNDPKLPY